MFRMYFSTFEGEFRGTDKGIQTQLKREQLMAMGASLGPGAMNPQELTLEDDSPDGDDHDHHSRDAPRVAPLP
jgi:NAD(P)H-quinone oxidoreductase subunit 5